jgi:hypothetical protein
MMAQSLRALLANLIDYAGLYPPAALPLPEVIANYERYLLSPEAWMLNRLVLPIEKLSEVSLGEKWRVTLLVDGEPGPLPPQIETLETKAGRRLSLPTYCEVPLDQLQDGYAKIRTAAPSTESVAEFLCTAAAPFAVQSHGGTPSSNSLGYARLPQRVCRSGICLVGYGPCDGDPVTERDRSPDFRVSKRWSAVA